jgi:uncharacterized protein YndB with AHSA1/START domain
MVTPPTWLETDDGSYILRASRAIDAPPDVVWALVSDPNRYSSWCETLHGQAREFAPGKEILLAIQILPRPFPRTKSMEVVKVIDPTLRAVAWTRDFGFGQVTERWQWVGPAAAGCQYHTALKLPSLLGAIVRPSLGRSLKHAFERIAEELQAEAVRRAGLR